MMIHHNRRTLTNTAIADLFDRVLNATHPRVAVPSRFPLPFGRVMGAHPLAQVHPVFLYNFPPPLRFSLRPLNPNPISCMLAGLRHFFPHLFSFFPPAARPRGTAIALVTPEEWELANETPTRFRACLPGCGTFFPHLFSFFP